MNDQGKSAASPAKLYQLIFAFAESYRNVGRLAQANAIATKQKRYWLPAVVNNGFSIELSLKFFLVAEHADQPYRELKRAAGINLRGFNHRCVEMWDAMPMKARNAVIAQYAGLGLSPQEVPDLRRFLSDLGDPFVRWRYPYEKTGVHKIELGLVENVADSLLVVGKKVCKRLNRGERTNLF